MNTNITFKATTRRTGNSYVVTIPSDYFKHGLLKEGKKYKFIIEDDNNGLR